MITIDMRQQYEISDTNRTSRPFGLAQSELSYGLDPFATKGIITRLATRFKEQDYDEDSRYNNDRYSDVKYLTESLQQISIEEYQRLGFSIAEIAAIHSLFQFSGHADSQIELVPNLFFVRKVEASNWHWKPSNPSASFTYKRSDNHVSWRKKVAYVNFFANFSFGLPDFEITIDHARGYNERGHGQFTRTWFDGEFGILVHYKGQYVLTISVSPTNNGLLVHQVQMKQKKGNRWLYQLPCHYLDYTISRLRLALDSAGIDLPIMLISGNGAVDWVKKHLPKAERESAKWMVEWDNEISPRIHKLYSKELTDFSRGEIWTAQGVEFYKLERNLSQLDTAA